MIERLRKHERQWRWARWLLLGAGMLSVGLCVLFGFLLNGLIAESQLGTFDAQTVFFIVLLWTKCFFCLLFSTWCFVTTWFKWHGDVNQMLLLRLLEAQPRAA